MSHFDLDHLLARAVHDYHLRTMPHIKPAGSAAARARAAHRRRTHLAAVGAALLLVLALPVAIYAVLGTNHSGARSAPPITENELRNATLQLPAWEQVDDVCPSGTVSFHNGQTAAYGSISVTYLAKTARVDVDHDGSSDVVAIFTCDMGNPGWDTAVAFRRGADNSIQTMGTVVKGVNQVRDVRAGANGTVDLQVSDRVGPGGNSALVQVLQWRAYGWTGSGFNQTGGPTSFTVDAPISATVSDLVYEPAVDGARTGHLTISLHNEGSETISDIWMLWSLYPGTLSEQTCSAAERPPAGAGRCDIGSLAPGATFEATLTYIAPAADVDIYVYNDNPLTGLSQISPSFVQIRIGDRRLITQPTLGNLVAQ